MKKLLILSVLFALPSFSASPLCKDLFGKMAPDGSFAKLALLRGVRSVAVPFPIRHLPELMNGKELNNIPTGLYPLAEGIVGFYALLEQQMDAQDTTRMLSLRSWKNHQNKDVGDYENAVLLFSVEILDQMSWIPRARTSLHRIGPMNWNPHRVRSAQALITDIELWAQLDTPYVLATLDPITIEQVQAIWVHPKKQDHFQKLWKEGYAKSEMFDLDFQDLARRVIFSHKQPENIEGLD